MLRRSAIIIALSSATLLAQEAAKSSDSCSSCQMPGIRKITFGGQYRLRYEGMFNYDLDSSSSSAANEDYFTQRVRFDLGIVMSDKLSAFLQFQDAREWGEETSTIDDNADGFDLHQGYVDVKDIFGEGGNTRVGRQEINLGDQRLVGALDWKSQARALDGVLQTWNMDDSGSLHAWVVQAREVISTTLAPSSNDDALFAGLWHQNKYGDDVDGSFYFMQLHDDGINPGQTHNRSTLGTRWIMNCCAPWEFGFELATQFGEQGDIDIPFGETYAAHVHAAYSFDDAWKTKFTVACDLASGDDPNTADNERFNNLFPTAHAHWGMMDMAQWENLFNPWVRVEISPTEDDKFALTALHFEAMEEGDVFKGPANQLSAGNPAFGKEMGQEVDFLWTRKLHWAEGVKTSLQLGYGIFVPGSGAEDAMGNDDLAHFAYAQFNVDF